MNKIMLIDKSPVTGERLEEPFQNAYEMTHLARDHCTPLV
jgi:hypothetical protein